MTAMTTGGPAWRRKAGMNGACALAARAEGRAPGRSMVAQAGEARQLAGE
jgi:hypothetical protein